MSRTWKTRPWRVRMTDKRDRDMPVEAFHDHSNGDCDLPSLDKYRKIADAGRIRTRCHWMPVYVGKRWCACPVCSGIGWNDDYNTRARRERKAMMREREAEGE